jgi:hypothetical protein
MSRSVVKYYAYNQEAGVQIPVTGPEWFDLWTDTSAMQSSNWFQSMSNKVIDTKNVAVSRVQSMIRGDRYTNESFLTARRCPTIIEYMSRCLVVKAPCDIDFAITDGFLYGLELHDKVYTVVPADERIPLTAPHPKTQYTGKSEHFKDHINIKLDTLIKFVCPPNIEAMFQQPIYHNPNAPFKVIPGVFTEPYKRYAALIWNVMVPDTVEEFSIKKGDALFYVYFNDRVMFEYTKEPQGFFKDRFNKPQSLITDILGKELRNG